MRRYETVFVVNPQADIAAIDGQVAAVTDLIKTNGGEIMLENRMGTRRLAYPLAGLLQGNYTSVIFDAETSILPKLERLYKLEEPYIRHLTIRYEGFLPVDGEDAASIPDDKRSDSRRGDRGGRPDRSDRPAPSRVAPKADAPKADAPKADAPKADAPKAEAPKADAPKADAPKADAPKADAPKADAPKADAPKADAPKADAPAPAATETEKPKADQSDPADEEL